MEMQYTPFRAAGKAAADNTPGAQKSNMTLGLSKKQLSSDHKGLLTVTLIRCIDLEVSMLLATRCMIDVAHTTRTIHLYVGAGHTGVDAVGQITSSKSVLQQCAICSDCMYSYSACHSESHLR